MKTRFLYKTKNQYALITAIEEDVAVIELHPESELESPNGLSESDIINKLEECDGYEACKVDLFGKYRSWLYDEVFTSNQYKPVRLEPDDVKQIIGVLQAITIT